MANNPYAPPRAQIADVFATPDSFQPVRIFSVSGRIGRLRYLAYLTGGYFVIAFGGGVLAGILAATAGPSAAPLILILIYVPLLVFSVMIAIQRSHDMDWSGWTVPLMIIPIVGLIWLFKAGSPGENRFGAPPPPNTTGVKILAWLFPLIMIIGIVAAIAIPAYQGYVKRAQSFEQTR